MSGFWRGVLQGFAGDPWPRAWGLVVGFGCGVAFVVLMGCMPLKAKPQDCYDRAVTVRHSCMQGVTEQGAVRECTEQMSAAYELCQRAAKELTP